MIPEPSKRPFGSPLDESCLPWFCHPTLPVFSKPVRDPRDNSIWAASGYWAVRFRTGRWFASDFPDASPEYLERVDALPWQGFIPDPEKHYNKPEWRDIDSGRGTIYRGGSDRLKPLWLPAKEGQVTISMQTLVRICKGFYAPLALLQLLARLPRCELLIDSWGFLYFRFNGGEGVVPDWWKGKEDTRPMAKFFMFLPKDELRDLKEHRGY